MSIIFETPLLERHECDVPYTHKDYTLAQPAVKEMMMGNDACGVMLVVDSFGYARMNALPRPTKDSGTTVNIVGNVSNEELAVALLQPNVLGQSVGILPLADVPTSQPYGDPLTNAQLRGTFANCLLLPWLDCRIV